MVTGPGIEGEKWEEPAPGRDQATRLTFVSVAKEESSVVLDRVLAQQAKFIDLEENGLEIYLEGETYKFAVKVYER